MARLPKSIIKKYGITRKAWAVFRGTRATKTRKTKSVKTRSYTMARHKKHSKKSGKGFMGKVMQIAIGAGVAALYEVFISPMIPLSRNVKNILELALGILLASMPRMPMAVRAGGAALATINAFEIIVPLISGAKQNVTSGGGNLSAFLQN